MLCLSMTFGSLSVPVYSAEDMPAQETDAWIENETIAPDTEEDAFSEESAFSGETAEFEEAADSEEVTVVALDGEEPEGIEEEEQEGAGEEREQEGAGDDTISDNAAVEKVWAISDGNSIFVFNPTDTPLYAVVLDPDDMSKGVSANSLKGEPVSAGGKCQITMATLADGSQKPLEYDKSYYVFASKDEQIILNEENLVRADEEDDFIYTDPADFTDIKAPADAAALLDGEKIGLVAAVQKNNTVKFKWQNKAESKTYKTFELSRLKSDGNWEIIMPSSGKKAFTEGVDRFQASDKRYTEIYKLECKDESGNSDSYVTVPAPMIYYVESGEAENTMDFAFTSYTRSPQIGYDMEVSTEKNFSAAYTDHEGSVDMDEPVEFAVSKKIRANCYRSDFYCEGLSLNVGTQYYCRVRATLSLGDLTVKGAPSVVKAVKQGPLKCDLFDIIGISPEGNEALGNGSWFPNVNEGYAVFHGPEPSKVKGYELLSCDTRYGNYKVLKKVPVTAVKPYYPPQFSDYGIETEGLYSIKLDNISPETRYYAVRALSSTGNARGGFADGVMCWAQYARVSELQVADSDISSVTLSFRGESGVNEYWIYRDTVSANLSKELSPSQYVGKVRNKFKKSGQTGTVYYTDKKDLVEGTVYYYTVRPVYTKTFADKQKYDFDFVSDPMVEGYGETLAEPVSAKPSIENAVIKNVRAKVASVKQVQVTWSAVKGASKYNIYLVDGTGQSENEEFKKILTVEKGSSEFKSRKVTVEVPKVGHTYTFGVNAGGNSEDSKYATLSSSLATYPGNPSKISAVYSRYGNRGAKLTWTNPSEDREYRGFISYEIQYRDNEGRWEFLDLASASSTSYTDTYALTRGVEREYRMRALYSDKEVTCYNSKVTGAVSFCKPYRITVANSSQDSVGSITIDPGQTYTFRVYFYDRHGNKDVVTDKKLDTVRLSDTDVASLSTSGNDKEYVIVKVTGKKSGTTKLTVRARDYDDDSSRLSRTVTINVRNKTTTK